MKQEFNDIKTELKITFSKWQKIKSRKLKAFLVVVFIGLIGLKVFTTVLTFDWLADLFKTI